MGSQINTTIDLRHDGQTYKHASLFNTVFVYIGDALKDDPQICLHADGSVGISASHFTDEKTAQMIRKVIKSAGGTVESKQWWAGTGPGTEIVKRKKDATRYTQDVRIRHGKTTIEVSLFVDLA